LRKTVVYIVLAFVIALSLITLIVGNALSQSLPDVCEKTSYQRYELYEVKSKHDVRVTECFCKAMGPYAVIPDDPELYVMCQDYLLDAYLPEIYALIGSLVITIINNIVKKLLIKLGNFSRYKTLSHESSSLMATIFIAQIINTAIIPILVTYRYKDYIPTAMFSKILYLKFVDTKEENYTDDLNRQWYLQVGLKYMMAFLIMIFNPYLINFFLTNPFSICWRKWRFKKAVIHKEAKKYSHGPTFQLT